MNRSPWRLHPVIHVPVSTASTPVTDLFKSLADATRLRVLRALQEAELGVGELAQVLGLAQSGVSRHLAVLRAAGLVRDRREGTSNLYRLAQPPADPRAEELWPLVAAWIGELPEAHGDRERLDRVLRGRSASGSAEYFQEVAPSWDSLRAAQYGEELRHSALLELVARDLRVLDVGTGTGFMLLGLAGRVRHLIGVDRSEAMLDRARENLRQAGVAEPDLRLGGMESLPVETASVDVVLCNMALHHAAEPSVAAAEMARALAPGGRLVLTDLARHDLIWTREELADEWPGFAPEELRETLAEAGLADVRVRTVGTCSLQRRESSEKHAVDVLLVTATKES